MSMRVASLVSGGKDSLFASWVVQQWGWDVAAFVTVEPAHASPMLFHRPNVKWVGLQAEAAGVRWVRARSASAEDESEALERALSGLEVDGITTGALASEYQRTRFERVGSRLGLKTFSPLWHHEPVQHLRDLLGSGFGCRFVHVAAEGLGRDWLGASLDAAAIERLAALSAKTRLHPAGEGGEYETFVTHAPQFRASIEIVEAATTWNRDSGTFEIKDARLGTPKASGVSPPRAPKRTP